jgi:UDP-2,3-diacylglucosamine pyrophosphatase LpxH
LVPATLRATDGDHSCAGMSPNPSAPQLRFRTVFISDVHLGFRGCSAEYLLDFLRSFEADTLYLVGDIIDLWSLKKTFFWPQTHNNVIRTILGKAKNGTRVVYIPGNHDSVFREYDGMQFGNVEIRREAIHETADRRRLLVLHGDEFDSVIKASPLLGALGNRAYALVLRLNRYVSIFRRRFGFPYWSLAAYLKHKVRNAVTYIANFEAALADEARRRGLDGLVCGHIHRAGITSLNGVLYCNDGDWVESCTTLIEDCDGRLSLLRWTDRKEVVGRTDGVDAVSLDRAA